MIPLFSLLLGAAILVGVIVLLVRSRAGGRGVLESAVREEFRLSREEALREARALREEIANTQAKANEAQLSGMRALAEAQKRDFAALTESVRQDRDKARDTLDRKLSEIQERSERKLDQMRQTVDEKLQSTIEKRLGASFKLVSGQLEAVQRGLGEMRDLASGVGDLKRVLTNVKDRGTWGEYQLEAILEQILTPEQFERNVATKPGGGRVEFAVKFPGKAGERQEPVWLPIDAKFPKEDYERLLDAAAQALPDAVAAAARALQAAVKRSARDIHDKYIDPPHTTDFGIMFLPTEGLYAEILRQPGLHDELQRTYRVLVAGPTTLAAVLSSFRIGFQTLAIEKRAHEVWKVLAAVKTEFGRFEEVLDRLKRQLETASNTIDQSKVRTRAMDRKLRSVEAMPACEAEAAFELAEDSDALQESSAVADARAEEG